MSGALNRGTSPDLSSVQGALAMRSCAHVARMWNHLEKVVYDSSALMR